MVMPAPKRKKRTIAPDLEPGLAAATKRAKAPKKKAPAKAVRKYALSAVPPATGKKLAALQKAAGFSPAQMRSIYDTYAKARIARKRPPAKRKPLMTATGALGLKSAPIPKGLAKAIKRAKSPMPTGKGASQSAELKSIQKQMKKIMDAMRPFKSPTPKKRAPAQQPKRPPATGGMKRSMRPPAPPRRSPAAPSRIPGSRPPTGRRVDPRTMELLPTPPRRRGPAPIPNYPLPRGRRGAPAPASPRQLLPTPPRRRGAPAPRRRPGEGPMLMPNPPRPMPRRKPATPKNRAPARPRRAAPRRRLK